MIDGQVVKACIFDLRHLETKGSNAGGESGI